MKLVVEANGSRAVSKTGGSMYVKRRAWSSDEENNIGVHEVEACQKRRGQ